MPVALLVLTDYELSVGFRSEDEQEQYDRVADSMTIEPLTRAATERAVAIQRRLRSQGSEVDGSDVLIAATAAESDDSRVLTRNVDKFERVEAIAIETY